MGLYATLIRMADLHPSVIQRSKLKVLLIYLTSIYCPIQSRLIDDITVFTNLENKTRQVYLHLQMNWIDVIHCYFIDWFDFNQ